jgi:hypothetical protein
MSRDHITDAGHFGSYFHYMLNMADDDLDPYEYRLLGHYRRVCGLGGQCTQSVRDIAAMCRMSAGMVTKTREKLAKGGWITARRLKEKGADIGYIVTVIDRMKENTERYADKAKGVHVVNTPVHDVNTGVHVVKQRINNNKNQLKEIAAAKAVGAALEAMTPEQLFDFAASHNKQTASIIPLVVDGKPKRKSARRPYFDAIVAAFGFDAAHITKTEASGIGKVESELKAAGYTVEDIPRIYAYCVKQDFKNFTPAALSKHAGAWRKTYKPAAQPAAVHLEPERVITEAERAANLDLMRANRPDFGGKAAS